MIAGKGVIIPGSNISGNTLLFESVEDFPLVGQANTLYVDKTTYFIYLWQGEGYETADFNIPSPPQPPEPTTLFFDSKEDFPGTGETDKVYISKDNGISWTWNATHEKYIDSEGRTGVYKALLSQSGTNAPTAVVQLNTLGEGTPVYSYEDVGYFKGSLAGAFTTNKTSVSIQSTYGADYGYVLVEGVYLNEFIFSTFNIFTAGDYVNGALEKSRILIEVYP